MRATISYEFVGTLGIMAVVMVVVCAAGFGPQPLNNSMYATATAVAIPTGSILLSVFIFRLVVELCRRV
jgi:hypothetical protein